MTSEARESRQEWFKKLAVLLVEHEYCDSEKEAPNLFQAFEDYFEDGYTAEEAIREDLSYAD